MKVIQIIAMTVVWALYSYKPLWCLQRNNYRMFSFNSYWSNVTKAEIQKCIMWTLAVLTSIYGHLTNVVFLTVLLTFLACGMLLMNSVHLRKLLSKKRLVLVLTKRAKRLFASVHIMQFIVVFSLSFYQYFWILSVGLIPVLPVLIGFINAIVSTFEKRKNNVYINNAKQKLNTSNLIKIGVTGSCGKTSVKFILKEMLLQKYKVLFTPSNFNTPMGIAKTLENKNLKEYDVFIAEMGARRKGDIGELMELIRPSHTILTKITNQHIDTFKKLSKIIYEKTLAIKMLPENGVGIANLDDQNSSAIFGDSRVQSVSSNGTTGCKLFADEIICDLEKTEFKLHYMNMTFTVTTSLVGRHNVTNILLASAMALNLGLDIMQIIVAVKNIKHIDNRLSIIKSNGYTILDDTYNANIEGVKTTAELLTSLTQRKILFLQGIEEGGMLRKKINNEVGQVMASVADEVALIGKNSNYIKQGLMKNGLLSNRIRTFGTLKEAVDKMSGSFMKDDVIYFQNDLGDL